MISLNQICLRPTSTTGMTSLGFLGPLAYRVVMMITTKNGAMTTAIAAMTTGRKARGPGNFVNADQITSYTVD